MKKPKKKTKQYYNYLEIRDYLQEKYDYDESNYTNKSFQTENNTPYLNFWHWVIDRYEIHNGCFITFTQDVCDGIKEEWAKTIYSHYLEFAEDGELVMFVEW